MPKKLWFADQQQIKDNFMKLILILSISLVPLIFCSCSWSSKNGLSWSDSDSVKKEKEQNRKIRRKTDRILEVGRINDRGEARRQAKGEVFEEEFFRSLNP